jgi:hypothetical protein
LLVVVYSCDEKEGLPQNQKFIRELIKGAFGISVDAEAIQLSTADIGSVMAYNESGLEEDGPNFDDLQIDMLGSIDAVWNKRVIVVILDKVRELEGGEDWFLPYRSDDYIKDMIKDKVERIRGEWRAVQPLVMPNGDVETDEQWETRIIEQDQEALKSKRHLTRRRNVSATTEMQNKGTNMAIEVRSARKDCPMGCRIRNGKRFK